MATVNVTSLSSLIKNYLPKYRKAQVLLLPCGENKESGPVDRQLQIVSDFQALNARIDTLSQIFCNRMQTHEQQLFSIMQCQIKKMQQQCEAVVKQYNQLIVQKNKTQELWDLRYEVRHYQLRATELYEENVVLKQQIATMKQKICQADLAWKCDQMALQNVSKKLLREKMLRKKEDFGFRLQTDPIKDFSRLIPINKSHESVDRVQDWTTFSKEIKKGRGIEYQSSPLNRSEIQVTRKELLAPLRSQGELNNAMSHSKNGSIPITGQKTVETSQRLATFEESKTIQRLKSFQETQVI